MWPFLGKLNSGPFDSNLIGVRAPASSHYQFLGKQLTRLTASLDADDHVLSGLSRRAGACPRNDFDPFFLKNLTDRLADLRLIAVGEQLLAALHNRDLGTEAVKQKLRRAKKRSVAAAGCRH
jgi:hypothetical protein